MVTIEKQDLLVYLHDLSISRELKEILAAFGRIGTQNRHLLVNAPMRGLLGTTGATNVQNEQVTSMDHEGNKIAVHELSIDCVGSLISEEIPQPLTFSRGNYTCCCDPIDGSSGVGISPVGSIFGVYDRKFPESPGARFMVHGSEQVAAAFIVYGVPTIMILTVRQGVQGFTLDPARNEWVLTHPDIRIPKPKYASVNWMNLNRWSERVKRGVEAACVGLSGRYSGSLVEDILRILLKGGVFIYPADTESPNGKLRMLYELCPISLILQEAGGIGCNGEEIILNMRITEPHQRSPFIGGDTELVLKYLDASVGLG